MPQAAQRNVLAGIFLAAIAGLALRLFMLDNRALTYDEAATAYFAAMPLADLWGEAGRLETNPPLFYTLAGIGARLGLSPEWLRLVSILPDIATIGVGGGLAWRLGGPWAGVAAAWLIAGSATIIEVSLEARAYSLLALFGVATLALAAQALAARTLRDGPPLVFVALGLCEVAALYTHNLAVLMIGAVNGVALVCWLGGASRPVELVRRWLVTQALVGAAWLYWLPTVLRQTTHDLAAFWIVRPDLSTLRYAMQTVAGLPWVEWPQPLADLVFIGLGGLGLAVLVWRPGFERWFGAGMAAAVLVGVPLATWTISQWRPLMNGRVLLWLVPLHIVLVGVALGRLRHAGLLLAAGLVALQLHGVPFWRPVAGGERWPAVAALLRRDMAPGDAILLEPGQTVLMLTHYGWQPDGHAVFGQPEGHWYRDFPGTTLSDTALGPGQRLWVITRRATPWHEAAVARLAATHREVRLMRGGRRAGSGVDVSLLVPR